MQDFIKRIIRLFFGLFLYSLGIAVTMKGNIGFAPWEVFHKGVSNISGLTIGQISIITGFFICIIVLMMGEKLGIGTLLNMLMLGIFLDIILKLNFIPRMESFFSGVLMLFLGLFIMAVASFFYISSSFGAGPRDSLMVALEKKTGLTSGMCKGIIEACAVSAGWFLGGPVGLGTVIAASGVGFCVEIVFRLFKFEPAKIEHETFSKTFSKLILSKN